MGFTDRLSTATSTGSGRRMAHRIADLIATACLFLTSFLVGCGAGNGSDPPDPHGEVAHPSSPQPDCRVQVQEIQRRLSEPLDPPRPHAPRETDVPIVESGSPPYEGASDTELALDASGTLTLEGAPGTDARLLEHLEGRRLVWWMRNSPGSNPQFIHLWAHPQAPMERVAHLAQLVGERRIALLATVRSSDAPDCPSSLSAYCDADPDSPVHERNEQIIGATGECLPLVRGFRRIFGAFPPERVALVGPVLSDALDECGCREGVDLRAIEFLALDWRGAHLPAVRAFVVPDSMTAAEVELSVGEWVDERYSGDP